MMDILYTGEHLTVLAADSSATDMPYELAGTLFGIAGGLVGDFSDQLRLRRDRLSWVRNCRVQVDLMFEQLERDADGSDDDSDYADEWEPLDFIGGGE